MITRYRVRAGSKTFKDAGPDLLRPKDNAKAQLRTLLRKFDGEALQFRLDDGEFKNGNRKMILFNFENRQFERFAVVRKSDQFQVAVVQKESITETPTAACHPKVSLNRALTEHQFPGIKFAGGYVYKESFPGFFSDHAYGDAFDETENKPKGVHNDAVFDWQRRMALANCMDFDYILGSKDGLVVEASAPDFEVELSRASSSHLWHVHQSVIDHDGQKPKAPGGHG